MVMREGNPVVWLFLYMRYLREETDEPPTHSNFNQFKQRYVALEQRPINQTESTDKTIKTNLCEQNRGTRL